MWGNEIANIQSVGVECTRVIKAVEFLLHIPEGDQPIAIEGPAVRDRFRVNANLVEKIVFLSKTGMSALPDAMLLVS